MIISRFDPTSPLHQAFGIDMGDIDLGPVESLGVGAGWGRLKPGVQSDAHQHDETETFVIVAGQGDAMVDGVAHPVGPGTVIQFEPFETHYLHNTGDTDILFATFYWRDSPRAAKEAARPERRRFDERPVFVFSSPTTPNGDLHIGHLSGPYLGADVFARFQRLNGARCWHIAGSDDFQSYVVGTARREGRAPEDTAAYYSAEILATHKLMDIQVDEYTVSNRDPGYVQGVQDFYARIAASDSVRPVDGPALFDTDTGRYLYEVDVKGSCPTCGNRTGGNMCEECGEPNFCFDLGGPTLTYSSAPAQAGSVVRQTVDLVQLRRDIELHHRLGRVPARVKELTNRVLGREALEVAITHPAEWGVRPLDGTPEGQVIWVWVDMAYRFLYGIEALGKQLGEDWRADDPQADWKIVHFLGFDNTFYHAIFCPAMYKLAYPDWEPDIDYNLNEFYLLDGAKFSTSRNHAIWGKDILNPKSVDSVRCYLSWTRPELVRTNFERPAYEAFVHDVLVGRWQAWLNDLGRRLDQDFGGIAPDAGIWRPEHIAFLAGLELRLSALAGALGEDGFSLNRAADALLGTVDDARRFAEQEADTDGIAAWKDETRTAIALQLAAAKLLAYAGAPLMPRFAAALAAALGVHEATEWPQRVTLVDPGTRVNLATQVFFTVSPTKQSVLLGWLCDAVGEVVQTPLREPLVERTLVELGVTSMQAIALQYKILEKVGVDIRVEDLLGERTLSELALFIESEPVEHVLS